MSASQVNNSHQDLIDRLKKIPLFKKISEKPGQLETIIDVLEAKTVSAGQEIITEGETGDEMFILVSGEIEISKFTMDRERFTVAKLKDDANVFFGELALVDDDKRSASVTAVSACSLLVLKRQRFLELAKSQNEIGWILMLEISQILSKRLRKANDESLILFEALVNELSA